MIDSQLLPKAMDSEAKVYDHKMKGDYYRFIYEFSTESIDKDISGDNAEVAYKNANELAKR